MAKESKGKRRIRTIGTLERVPIAASYDATNHVFSFDPKNPDALVLEECIDPHFGPGVLMRFGAAQGKSGGASLVTFVPRTALAFVQYYEEPTPKPEKDQPNA